MLKKLMVSAGQKKWIKRFVLMGMISLGIGLFIFKIKIPNSQLPMPQKVAARIKRLQDSESDFISTRVSAIEKKVEKKASETAEVEAPAKLNSALNGDESVSTDLEKAKAEQEELSQKLSKIIEQGFEDTPEYKGELTVAGHALKKLLASMFTDVLHFDTSKVSPEDQEVMAYYNDVAAHNSAQFVMSFLSASEVQKTIKELAKNIDLAEKNEPLSTDKELELVKSTNRLLDLMIHPEDKIVTDALQGIGPAVMGLAQLFQEYEAKGVRFEKVQDEKSLEKMNDQIENLLKSQFPNLD